MFGKSVILRLGSLALLLSLAPSGLSARAEVFQLAHTYYSGGDSATSIAVGDVNKDGKLDVVAANWCVTGDNCSGGTVGVLLGNGDGTFQPAQSYGAGIQNLISVAIGDVNGDGNLDIVVAIYFTSSTDNHGAVGILLGNGDGTFRAEQSYSSGGYFATSVAISDLNHDDHADVMVTNDVNLCDGGSCQGDGSVGVLLGNGNGTFQSAHTYDSAYYGAGSIAVSDFNGDTHPDLLVGNMGKLGVLLGNGDGTFQAAVAYDSGGYYATSVAVGDVNGDGRLDLVVANRQTTHNNPNGQVGVLLGKGNGTFQPVKTFRSGSWMAYAIAVSDLNRDGKIDLLVTDESGLGPWLGHGDGTFEVARRSSGGISIAVGDVNGDTRPDALVANGGVEVLLNVIPFLSTTTLSSSMNPSIYGQAVTLTVTVTSDGPFAPSGTVTFKNGDAGIGTAKLVGGVAMLTKTNLPSGALSITALYNGDSDSARSTSAALVQVVNPATTVTTIKSSVNPSVQGQAVKFTATVTSPTAKITGTVTFTAGATTLGTVALSRGKANIMTSALPLGSNSITATYGGTANIVGSAASLTQIVE